MSAAFKRCAAGVLAGMLLMAGCQSTPPPATESTAAKAPAGPPQLIAAKAAFAPMYKSAIAWASDVVPLKISSKDVPGFKNAAGKAAMWEAVFASPSLHQYRTDTYAITTVLPDIHKGAAAGMKLPWAGATRDAMPIEYSGINIDSDAAYQAAAADAADWLKKNPDKQLTSIELGNAYVFHTPVWGVVWGDSKSGYIAFVDANTGKVLKKK